MPLPYDIVREKVIEACPEILDLKFGCKIIVDLGEYDEVTVLNECGKCTKHKKYTSCNEDCETDDAWYVYGGEEMEGYYTLVVEKYKVKEILGSEITLSHILRTIEKLSGEYILVSKYGKFHKRVGIQQYEELGEWNLEHDSLSWHTTHQPSTVAFLGDLLANN